VAGLITRMWRNRRAGSAQGPGSGPDVQPVAAWLGRLTGTGPWRAERVTQNFASRSLVFVPPARSADLPPRIFVKRFAEADRGPDGRMAREVHALQMCGALAGHPKVATPTVLGVDEAMGVVALAHIRGPSLFNELWNHRGRADARPRLASVGAWLAALHAATPEPNAPGAEVTDGRTALADDRRMVMRKLGFLAETRPRDFGGGRGERVGAAWERMAAPLAERPVMPIHGDFTAVNMIVREDGGVAIVDLAAFTRGHPQNDLARLCAELLLIDRAMPDRPGPLCLAFLGGYAEAGGKDWGAGGLLSADLHAHLVKHLLINCAMMVAHVGSRNFLNPLQCMLLYRAYRRMLRALVPA
jgi:aminoglycoside phosphotransferase (APT) family kinase protein